MGQRLYKALGQIGLEVYSAKHPMIKVANIVNTDQFNQLVA